MRTVRTVPVVAATRRRTPSRAAAVGIAAATLLVVASGCAATASAGAGDPGVSATHAGVHLTFDSPDDFNAHTLSASAVSDGTFTPIPALGGHEPLVLVTD